MRRWKLRKGRAPEVEVNFRVGCKRRPLYTAVDGVRGELVPAAPHRSHGSGTHSRCRAACSRGRSPPGHLGPREGFTKVRRES